MLSLTSLAGVRPLPRVSGCSRHVRVCRAAQGQSSSASGPARVQDIEWVEPRNHAEAPAVQKQLVASVADSGFLTSSPPDAPTPLVQRVGSGALYGAAAFFGATLMVSLVRYYQKYNGKENKSRRRTKSNMNVVKSLSEYLPLERTKVDRGMINKLKGSTGFTYTEIFRKFLWYILRDRPFDDDAVGDLLHLKSVMGLTADDVADALKERSIRIEGKYGNLMLSLEGLSERGVQRKATCRALFSKMLYLAEEESLLPAGNEHFNVKELRNIFGATEEDVEKLRIVSLKEVDINVLDQMFDEKVGGDDKK